MGTPKSRETQGFTPLKPPCLPLAGRASALGSVVRAMRALCPEPADPTRRAANCQPYLALSDISMPYFLKYVSCNSRDGKQFIFLFKFLSVSVNIII